MNLSFSVEDEAFRRDVQSFLATALTPELQRNTARMTSVYSPRSMALDWQARLAERGWVAPSWPEAYGGCNWSISQKYIFDVEMARAGAPPLSPMGISMCGPALIGFGSDAQKEHFLPRILTGDDFWCQGYSEPHAGSDLAALTMSAVDDGDAFICNGSKIWTTHAHEANMMFCLVRTDATGKPQQGITFLLIDMETPGVTVDPIIMLSGEHIQNAVFFEDVRLPKANVVGEIDKGWTVAKYLLEFERGGSAYGPRLLARLGKLRLQLDRLEASTAHDLKARLATIEIACLALDSSELQMMAELSAGGSPGLKASIMKIRGTELSQAITELAVEIAGYHAHPFQPQHTCPGGPVVGLDLPPLETPIGALEDATVSPRYFNDRAGSIYAGSNEIQKNIIAKHQLGL